MIATDIKGRMTCDADGCSMEAPGRFMLGVGGGLAFKPSVKGWQFAAGPNGVYMTRCPKHQALIAAPNGRPAIVDAPKSEPGAKP